MKVTIIVVVILCLVVGGIAGWALRGMLGGSKSVAMIDITPDSYADSSRVAIYDGGTLVVADFNPSAGDGSTENLTKIKIR